MEPSTALLEVRGLTRRPWFAARDLTVGAGEIVVLSGATGSGKTLFLRAVADLDAADAGEVHLDAVPRGAFEPALWRRQVLYVHQSGVRVGSTVGENLRRVATLQAIQAEPTPPPGLAVDADADRLSGGERQALALHRALLCQPTVLLLDESTSAMDAATAHSWEQRIRTWAGEGKAVLWVAHDAGLAERVDARVESFP